jgi:hypothetical protein
MMRGPLALRRLQQCQLHETLEEATGDGFIGGRPLALTHTWP